MADGHGPSLKGKTALIAGASRNLGKTIALAFAAAGAENLILVASKSFDELKQVADECEQLGANALPLQADLSRPDEASAVVRQGLEHYGYIHILVVVAGIRPHKSFSEIEVGDWIPCFAANLDPTFYLAKAMAPTMIAKRLGGSIVTLGGVSSLTAQPNRTQVITTKTALYGLTKSLALELGPYGVRANHVALGAVGTDRRNPEWYKHEGGDPGTAAVIAQSPLGRLGTQREATDVVLFLASDQSSYITGDRIVCAGGRYM